MIVVDLNNSAVARITGQKLRTKQTINYLDLIVIYWTLFPTTEEYKLFSRAYVTFNRVYKPYAGL